MKVLVTGANGFIGRNLSLRLSERADIEVLKFTRENDIHQLRASLEESDFVIHLAGVNRPLEQAEYAVGNSQFTQTLCELLIDQFITWNKKIPIIFASSIQAEKNNPYGLSKLESERSIKSLEQNFSIPTFIFRLPNVFGKWCRPNYNSAIATFCHNIARGIPIQINDRNADLTLVYVEDVVDHFIKLIDGAYCNKDTSVFSDISPKYSISVGELADVITGFSGFQQNLSMGKVGTGLMRALYSTYVSYLPTTSFSYKIPQYGDARGVFVEMLKTSDCGQFSYFTALPGITRGGHYHHSKTEKFLVIKGSARFKFEHMQTGERYEVSTSGDVPEIVETVPGWTHDVTNVGTTEMTVMLWANEVFDRNQPDTISHPL